MTAAACEAIATRLADFEGAAGSRDLLERDWCGQLSQQLATQLTAVGLLPLGHRAIQCNFFDKSADLNWLVALHQDLSVPVAERADAAGWSAWSVKQGQMFGQAPRALLEELVAVRLHLDACGVDDGPLRVVAGSHRSGVMSPEAARERRDIHGETSCTVERGGVLLMRPLLLHASSKSISGLHRRVLHFVYGPSEPGARLRWPQEATSIRC